MEYVVKYTEAQNNRKCYYNRCFLIIYLTGSSATSSVEPLASPHVRRFNAQFFNTTHGGLTLSKGIKYSNIFVAAFRQIFLKQVIYIECLLLFQTKTFSD